MLDAAAEAFGPSATTKNSHRPWAWAAGPWARRPTGNRSTASRTPRSALPACSLREGAHLAAPAEAAAPPAPIPRPSDRLPVGRLAQGPAAQDHGLRLFFVVALGPNASAAAIKHCMHRCARSR